ncbi:MAG: ATP-binding protein [Nanoarchaeota archaeon]|nr:ATP-binding protein [Nanoarchaeota archaeon]
MPYDIVLGRNETDKKLLGKDGLIYIGKGYVKMGQYTSLSNKIYLDVARSHVVLVAGKRGSGKSYTLGVLTEEISSLPKEVSQNIASLIFDTMGIYWTMKYENQKDKNLLQEWDLKPKNLPVKIFAPFGYYEELRDKGVPIDEAFALDPVELGPEDWTTTFGLSLIDPVSVLIGRAITGLKEQRKKFTIKKVLEELGKDKKSEKETINAAMGLFEAADSWGIFAREKMNPTKTKDLIKGGTTSVLDLSSYNSIGAFNVRALVISLISRKLFEERMKKRKLEEVKSISKGIDYSGTYEKKESPLVWMFIDEAHEFLPMNEKIISTDALIQILREGRQPGISIVLATQQPGKIHTDVMTQADIVISHRVTSETDIKALNSMMQSYLTDTIQGYMNDLPSLKGSAIILDDNSERIYPMRMRPRFTWHGGEAPSVVPEKKEL